MVEIVFQGPTPVAQRISAWFWGRLSISLPAASISELDAVFFSWDIRLIALQLQEVESKVQCKALKIGMGVVYVLSR